MSILTGIVKVVSAALNPKSLIKDVARKILLRPVIAAFKKLGVSNKDLWGAMKDMGFEKAGKSLVVDTAAYIATLDHVDAVRAISHALKVPSDIMVETYLPSARRYRYIANATIQYKGKRTSVQKYISFYTDSWKPLSEYADDIKEIIDDESYDLDYKIVSLDYEAVLHQKGDTYE